MKFRIEPRTDVDKTGRSLLYLIATENKRKLRINLNLHINRKEWNSKTQRLHPKEQTESSQAVNLFLGELESKIHKIKLEYFSTDKVLTLDKFEKEFHSGFSRIDFIQFAESICQMEEGLLAKRSNQKRKSVVEKIKLYKKSVLFGDVDMEFIQGYIKFWKKTHVVNDKKVGGNNQTTINSDLKVIKKWLRIARKNAIKLNIDIDDIKIGRTTGTREYLTDKELKVLWDFYFSPFMSDRYKLTVGVFLFGCFSSLRISDLRQISRSDLQDDINSFTSMDYNVTKTRKHHKIRFNRKALEVAEHNADLFCLWKSDQKMNEDLKDVMKILKVNKRISLHCSRHTFATNFLRAGGKVEQLQKILGHSSINETMIYVHILDSEKDDSIELLDALW